VVGHLKKAGTGPKRFLREERLAKPAELALGDTVRVDAFRQGDLVDVIGTIKGRGFAGTIKRHGFQRGPKSHGSMNYRQPGSIGTKRIGKLFPGKRMSGHYGASRQTTKNLEVVRIDPDRNLIFLKGAVPGPRGGFVQIQRAKTGLPKAPKAPAPKDKKKG
jgi:large subunit ribosomal protein L3